MISEHQTQIALILQTLSDKPGVYRFYDENEELLYVGKAKNLKRRVSSYFNKNHNSKRLILMVSKVRNIQTTIVNNQWEALLLENSMIKEHKPRFNIMLRDDKTYPWIAITKEAFPRIFLTRKPDRKNCEVFGPYAAIYSAHLLMNAVLETYQIRNCKIMPTSVRPCLQYQIKKCAAPCAGYISPIEYQENIAQIKEIIIGNGVSVIKKLKEEMHAYAEQWEFEKAQFAKEQIEKLENFRSKSVVVNADIARVDVFTIEEDEGNAYLNFMRVVDGAVIQSYTLEMTNKMENTSEELLLMGIVEISKRFGTLSNEVFVPFIPEWHSKEIKFIVPRGDGKKLLDLSQKNAYMYMMEKKKRQELINPERHSQRVLQTLQKVLGMEVLPTHIECFDNSNTQGEEPVAAMVCFLNGKPAKKEYRHFNIKTVEGPDDFASMHEVVYRRYSRLAEEGKPLPQLVLIDGGKGQLGMAYQALKELGLTDKIMLIGIAKRLEDIYKVGDSLPLYIDKKSEAQKLLQKIRDEVHRFGITHHRKRRGKKSLSSQLDQIPGVGKVLSQKLLEHFRSVKRIKEASEEDIAAIIGKAKALAVKEVLS